MSDNIITSTPPAGRTQSPTPTPPSRQEKQQQPHRHHNHQQQMIKKRRTIICDAYYGWPHQKRPRSERIRAVAQQIHNFYCLTTTPSSSSFSEEKHNYVGDTMGANELLVIGHETDLRPLYSRLEVLNKGHGMCWGDDEDDGDDDGDKPDSLIHCKRYGDEGMTLLNIVFLAGWTINDCFLRHNGERREMREQQEEGETSTNSNNTMTDISLEKGTKDHIVDDDNNNGNSNVDENVHERQQNDDINDITQQLDNISIPIANDFSSSSPENENKTSSSHHDDHPIYLSPDAPSTINPTLPPPTLVILGMLVDRRVTPGRSQSRAMDINVPSAKLPMSLLSLDNLRDEEPLNIDTVLDIMNGWWKSQRQQQGGDYGVEEEKERNVGNFLEAARMAMVRHVERHPGRTLHKT